MGSFACTSFAAIANPFATFMLDLVHLLPTDGSNMFLFHAKMHADAGK